MKSVTIKLTKNQKNKITDILKESWKDCDNCNKGLILGHILTFGNDDIPKLTVTYLPNKQSLKLIEHFKQLCKEIE